MKILGIGTIYHDPAACLLIDGRIVAAAEEERFSRKKHAQGEYPVHAIAYCLREAGLRPEDIELVAHPCSADSYDRNKWGFFRRALWKRPAQALKAITKAGVHRQSFLETPREAMRRAGLDPERIPIRYIDHHLAHAASAYYFSGFDKAATMTVDGAGELTATTLGYAEGGRVEMTREILFPDSLGFFYSTVTDFLGFEHMDGEYKLMGMAPFGDPKKIDISELIRYRRGTYRVNDDYCYAVRRKRYKKDKWYSRKFVERFGPPRQGDGLGEPYIHIAAAAQAKLEEITIRLVEDHLTEALKRSEGRLCFSGGCALNVKLNQRLIEHPLISELWVQPASSDAGIPLGAAALVAAENGDPIEPMTHAYFGPSYDPASCLAVFENSPHQVRRCGSITAEVSRLLAEGHIVAWFQGRMEWGPRALGNRSILGNPTLRGTADRINEIIKFRETWRPFCPSILKERAFEVLDTAHDSPFMTFSFPVREAWKKRIPEVVHVDGTARPQFVARQDNPRFHELLRAFEKRTGVPLLINTSLNRRGEPLVCSPQDALRMFEESGLEYLAIGDSLITKVRAKAPLPQGIA
jgi:carbamoyltransferase